MSKPKYEDKRKLEVKETHLQNMRIKSELKRNVTVTVSSENFYKTGIMCDVVQVSFPLDPPNSRLPIYRQRLNRAKILQQTFCATTE